MSTFIQHSNNPAYSECNHIVEEPTIISYHDDIVEVEGTCKRCDEQMYGCMMLEINNE